MGGSSSKGARTPYEAPNTLSSAQCVRIVDVISEGVIAGFANGDDSPFKSVYFNDTPVQNADGSYNFKGVTGYFHRGTPDQSYVPGFESAERTVAVSARVKKDTPIVRTVTDGLVSRVRVTVGVERNVQVKDNGDSVAARTQLKVDLIGDGGTLTKNVVFTEKSSGAYYYDLVFENLPPAPFNIRVSRVTDDAANDKVSNNTFFASYVEIIDVKMSYPNTAVAFLKIDSDQFGNQIPRRNYLLKGKLVQVPSDYDPVARTYGGGVWDGSFKTAWTNNPVWILYDLLTSPRYSSIARRLMPSDIDKWTMYQAAKYCDEMVSDGFGGREPRFVCNPYIAEQKQAGDLLTDLCSVFTGLPVWNGSQFSVVLDGNTDPVAQYNNSNVVGGMFTYAGVAQKAIHTAVYVQYIDKNDGWRKKQEFVQDAAAVKRYGFNVKNVTAFGCDSRGQAARVGAWVLQTELLQQNAISFTVGREGLKHLPYDVFQVTDNLYAGAELSGRVVSVSGSEVVLDRDVDNAADTALQYAVVSDGNVALKSVKVVGQPAKDTLRLESPAAGLEPGATWALSGKIKPRLYRAIGIKENTDEGTYTISALLHDPRKYSAIDNWARFDREVATLYTLTPQISGGSITTQGGDVVIAWGNGTIDGQILRYDIKVYRNDKLFRHIPDAKTAEVRLSNLPNGSYRVEIRAVNARGVWSEPLIQSFVIDYTVTGLRTTPGVFSINIQWEVPRIMTAVAKTELWYSKTRDLDKAERLADLSYPQNTYTMTNVSISDTFYFWARMVDENGISGEFTAAVAGRADQNPDKIVQYIQGAITASELSKDLINQLVGEVRDEAGNSLSEEIKKEAEKQTKALADKAAEIGVRITAVENVDRQQAQQIATLTASQGATAAGLEAEKKARADGDKAEASARQALVSRVGNVEGGITRVERSLASKEQALSERIDTLSSSVNTMNVGGRNLLRKSDAARSGADYSIRYEITEAPKVGEDVVITLWGSLGGDRTGIGVYNSHGYSEIAKLVKIADGVYQGRGKWKKPDNGGTIVTPNDTHLNVYFYPSTATGTNRVSKIKLERGTVGTDWTPAPEDSGDEVAAVRADIVSFRQTQAQKDSATATQMQQMKSELQTADRNINAAITQTQTTQATLNGKVNALYTLKTEAVSGGRRVVSGIAIGADGNTGDSQVLVYADKFAMVDPNSKGIKAPFVVVTENGRTKMALDGDMYATGSILGKHIAASQSIESPLINGGRINAGSFVGGNINIGNGNFTVASNGNLYAKNGRFEGTVVASRIEGTISDILMSSTVTPPKMLASHGHLTMMQVDYRFTRVDTRRAKFVIRPLAATGMDVARSQDGWGVLYVAIYADGELFNPRVARNTEFPDVSYSYRSKFDRAVIPPLVMKAGVSLIEVKAYWLVQIGAGLAAAHIEERNDDFLIMDINYMF